MAARRANAVARAAETFINRMVDGRMGAIWDGMGRSKEMRIPTLAKYQYILDTWLRRPGSAVKAPNRVEVDKLKSSFISSSP